MATRCTIEVEGLEGVVLYKHWDGYPGATLPWLVEFNRRFTDNRGVGDPSYKFAQLIRSSINDALEFGLDLSLETGWGVYVDQVIGGIDYHYTLKDDGSVTYV